MILTGQRRGRWGSPRDGRDRHGPEEKIEDHYRGRDRNDENEAFGIAHYLLSVRGKARVGRVPARSHDLKSIRNEKDIFQFSFQIFHLSLKQLVFVALNVFSGNDKWKIF